ncbi:hypothetical protein [Mycobacterium sp. NAZ190054]|uniref:hypothetical protein n=1 Tax=Mycobacterium sp. NAZ190054 TaxID=1747766 RepID=UPI0007927AB6|nr:hypothetical protein [Mycobacterium sp. NAZ190054]KWX66832.1 hypothetical protein ASJ79_05560 [Mycobacterium sp. NAZ190054]
MNAPKIVVELIEDEPDTLEEFGEYIRATDVHDLEAKYRRYLDRFQPFRWVAKRTGNHEPLAKSTESYFNRGDCVDAITLLFVMSTGVELVTHDNGIEERRSLR